MSQYGSSYNVVRWASTVLIGRWTLLAPEIVMAQVAAWLSLHVRTYISRLAISPYTYILKWGTLKENPFVDCDKKPHSANITVYFSYIRLYVRWIKSWDHYSSTFHCIFRLVPRCLLKEGPQPTSFMLKIYSFHLDKTTKDLAKSGQAVERVSTDFYQVFSHMGRPSGGAPHPMYVPDVRSGQC